MPIKDQCANCRFQDSGNCTKLVPSFDGTSCDVYAKRINLEKENEYPDLVQPIETESENQDDNFYDDEIEQPSDEDIHGWLKFFLIFFVGIGSFASLIISFVTFEAADNFWFSASDVAFALVYLATGIFTLVAFYKRDTDAVFLAKTFVILCFASNLLALFVSDGEVGSDKMVLRMIRSIIWCCIWFIFLCSSNQVQNIIPKSYRRTKTRDWIIIATVVLLPFICIGLGIASEKKSHTETETVALTNLSLGANQFSDGRVVLSVPDGVDCDETMAENTKVFSLSDAETGAEVTIVSDYDTDVTKKNFNQYWRGWKSDELDNIDYAVVKDEKKSNDDVTVFYKLIRVNVENPVDWEFALVFHHASGKVCLISGYSSSETNSPVAYIINNLKFL
ncbi:MULTISPECIES: hypothetical protein [Bacteroidales]|uniref:DUF2569 family protein n=1 Tax=Duncaniella freteri TaxID=2530391 RepID=A0A4Z0V8P6_9BACT|nr:MULTISPECIES: hypothetical protein [Bacteroidales]TGG40794.1 hypothetical protein EZ315_09010 [Duncaniella freteri]